MAYRDSLEELVGLMRSYGNVSTDDMTVAGVSYWSNDQLADLLDQHSMPVTMPLEGYTKIDADNDAVLSSYLMMGKRHWFEKNFTITDGSKQISSSTWTWTPFQNHVVFSEDPENYYLFLQGTYFDVNQAVAELWLQKAGHRQNYIASRAGGYVFEEDQVWQHCMKMHEQWMKKEGLRATDVRRDDYWIAEVPWEYSRIDRRNLVAYGRMWPRRGF